MPAVSVIIPTYNRPAMVVKAIQSVLEQTLPDFEIIVVDDGSRAETRDAVAAISDPRLRCVRQENAGRSVARNHGLDLATGEFVAFLDDDDTFLPHKLASQVDFLQSHLDIGLAAGGWHYVNTEGTVIGTGTPQADRGLELTDWIFSCPFMPCALLVRRQWAKQCRFERAFEPQEDWGYFLELAYRGCRMMWSDGVVCNYTMHGGNSIRTLFTTGSITVLDRFFAHPGLPDAVLALKNDAFARRYLIVGVRALSGGHDAYASKQFQQAFGYRPDWLTTRRDELAAFLSDSVREPTLDGAPLAVLDSLMRVLPAPSGARRAIVRRAKARVLMAEVFAAHARGDLATVRSRLLPALALDWRWLRNRGVLSLLAQCVVGKQVKAGLRG